MQTNQAHHNHRLNWTPIVPRLMNFIQIQMHSQMAEVLAMETVVRITPPTNLFVKTRIVYNLFATNLCYLRSEQNTFEPKPLCSLTNG